MSRTAPQSITQLFNNQEKTQMVVDLCRKYPFSLSAQDWYISGMDTESLINNPDVHDLALIHFQVGDMIAVYCFHDGEFRVLVSKEGNPEVGGTINVGTAEFTVRVSSFPEIVIAFFNDEGFLEKIGKDFDEEFCQDMKVLAQNWEVLGIVAAHNIFFGDYYMSITEMFFPTDVYKTREMLTFHDTIIRGKEVEEACQELKMHFRIHKDFMSKQVVADVYENRETIMMIEIENMRIRAIYNENHDPEKHIELSITTKDNDHAVKVVGNFTAEGIMMSARSLMYRMLSAAYSDMVEEFLEPLMTPNHFRLLRTVTRFPEVSSAWIMGMLLQGLDAYDQTGDESEGGNE